MHEYLIALCLYKSQSIILHLTNSILIKITAINSANRKKYKNK